MYYPDYYDAVEKTSSSIEGVAIWTLIAFILAIVGGILVYFLFLRSKNEFNKGVTTLKDLLDFKIMLIEPIMKVLYLIITIFIILFSFSLITVNFLAFILVLILGPILVRVVYELALINIMIWKNTRDINKKMK